MKIRGFLCFIWKKYRNQKHFKIFHPFSAISEKIRPKFSAGLYGRLNFFSVPFWLCGRRIGQLGTLNTTYLSLASSSLWLVSMSCCLMAASSRLMAKVVSSTSARFTWPCTKEIGKAVQDRSSLLFLFFYMMSDHLGKLPISSERPPLYSISAGRHWEVGECSGRVTVGVFWKM